MNERLRLWREKVLLRDNFTCRKCGRKLPNNKLQAHHIKSKTTYPELKYRVSNGKTLCFDCHRKEKSSKIKFILSKK